MTTKKYLIILSDQVLTVYDGTTAVNVASAGLLDAYISTVCVTQKRRHNDIYAPKHDT